MPDSAQTGLRKITVPTPSWERERGEHESQAVNTGIYAGKIEKNVTEFFSGAPIWRILLVWILGLIGWLIVNKSYNDSDWPWKYFEYLGFVPPG